VNLDDLNSEHARLKEDWVTLGSSIDTTFERLRTKLDTPIEPERKIRFASHRYLTTGPIDQESSFFDVLDYPDINRAVWPEGAERYRYATYVKRPDDELGQGQFLPPEDILPTEIARNRSDGDQVYRATNGGDYLYDLENSSLRIEAVNHLVEEVVLKGFTGVYLDEVDQTWWGWPGFSGASSFPTEHDWRARIFDWVRELSATLHENGKKLWVNLGADYDLTNPWQAQIVRLTDSVNIEHYVGREAVRMGPTVGSDWLRQGRFVRDCEKIGKPVHVHASTTTQWVVDYAFASWLIWTELIGSFSASIEYSGTVYRPQPGRLETLRRLDLPKEDGYQDLVSGLFHRKFQNGTLQVNPTTETRAGLASRSFRIV
jgi:hypothetical protein